jgi:hypothetical protein
MSSVCLFSLTAMGIGAGYRLNVTARLPWGLYQVTPVVYALQHSDLVTFVLPPELRLHCWLRSFTSRSLAVREITSVSMITSGGSMACAMARCS